MMDFLSAFWVLIVDNVVPLITIVIALYAVNVWKNKLRADVHLGLLQRLLSTWAALHNERVSIYPVIQFIRKPDTQKGIDEGRIDPHIKKDVRGRLKNYLLAITTFQAVLDESEFFGIGESAKYFQDFAIKNLQEANNSNIFTSTPGITQQSLKEFKEEQKEVKKRFYEWTKENFSDSIKIVKIKPKRRWFNFLATPKKNSKQASRRNKVI